MQQESKTTFIYTLSCPISNDIRYVGKTNNLKIRLNQHLKESKKNKTHKDKWISKLISLYQEPIIEILDEVNENEWQYWEMFYISLLKSWNFKLINHTIGGDGNKNWNGKNPTEKQKKNISKSFKSSEKSKNLWNSKDFRNKLSISRKKSEKVKKIINDENWKNKISESLKKSEKYLSVIKSKERNFKISESLKKSEKRYKSMHSEEFIEKCKKRERENPKNKEWYNKRQIKTNIKIKERQVKRKNEVLSSLLINKNDLHKVSIDLKITITSVYRLLKKFNIKINEQ